MIAAYAASPAPVERLWSLVGDVTAWPQHVETFTSITPLSGDGVLRLGAQFAVRQPGLPAATYEVTELDEGRAFTWTARAAGVTTRATHVITEAGGGCRLDLTIAWAGPLARLVALLLGRRTRALIAYEAQTFARLAASA